MTNLILSFTHFKQIYIFIYLYNNYGQPLRQLWSPSFKSKIFHQDWTHCPKLDFFWIAISQDRGQENSSKPLGFKPTKSQTAVCDTSKTQFHHRQSEALFLSLAFTADLDLIICGFVSYGGPCLKWLFTYM